MNRSDLAILKLKKTPLLLDACGVFTYMAHFCYPSPCLKICTSNWVTTLNATSYDKEMRMRQLAMADVAFDVLLETFELKARDKLTRPPLTSDVFPADLR